MARWRTRALLLAFSAILTEALAFVGFRAVHIPYDPIRLPYLDDGQRRQIQALVDHHPTYLVFDPVLGWPSRQMPCPRTACTAPTVRAPRRS